MHASHLLYHYIAPLSLESMNFEKRFIVLKIPECISILVVLNIKNGIGCQN
jgi:hypothetical protein